ncbi:hypothetical protein Y032_0273g966 [Ancylostoma ceylanicum]|nr:hypothetical protein Y032_0273g966 [Ancylostoma ceylanicum]
MKKLPYSKHKFVVEMSLGLLTRTSCQFCGLSYRTLDDLIAHVEYSHIPLITSLRMAQRQNSSAPTCQERFTPLSAVCRLFTTPYEPKPCEPEGPIRLTFNHCRRFRSEHRSAGKERDVSPCPIDGCGMVLESNDDWKAHLRRVHRISERVFSQEDSQETQATRAPVIERVQRCPQCRKFFKSSSRLLEHMEKRHKKNDSTKPSEVVVKVEVDEDLYQAVSPVIKEEPCAEDNKIAGRNGTIPQQPYETGALKAVVKEEPPSEQMFTNTPTSGHLLRQRLMQHRRTLMEDEMNEMKFTKEEQYQ